MDDGCYLIWTRTLWTCNCASGEKQHQMDLWKANSLQVQRFSEKQKVLHVDRCKTHFQVYGSSVECRAEDSCCYNLTLDGTWETKQKEDWLYEQKQKRWLVKGNSFCSMGGEKEMIAWWHFKH